MPSTDPTGSAPSLLNAPSGLSGPDLHLAPSALANYVTPLTPSHVAFNDFCDRLSKASHSLEDVLDSLAHAAEALSGAVLGVKAIAGIADAMAETYPFRTVGGAHAEPAGANKLATLRKRADKLAEKVCDKVGTKIDPRRFADALNGSVHDSAVRVLNLLRDPESLKILREFCEDPAIGDSKIYVNLWCLGQILTPALDLLVRTELCDQTLEIATECLEQGDQRQSVPAIAIAKANTSWGTWVAAMARVTGSTVGHLPGGMDSLSIALLKIYAAHRLPKAALDPATDNKNLEEELFGKLVGSLLLSNEEAARLRALKDDLKSAQADVIRRAQAEAIAAANVPNGPPRAVRAAQGKAEQKTQARIEAERKCKVAAEAVSKFYEGATNDVVAPLQRGVFMDGFCTVLAVIQLIAAFQEFQQPEVSKLQACMDLTMNFIITGGAVISMVGSNLKNLPTIDVGLVKLDLAIIGRASEVIAAGGETFGGIAGVLTAISGAARLATGLEMGDTEQILEGSLTMASGAMVAFGVLWSPVAVGAGVAIGVLLGVEALLKKMVDAVEEYAKNATEKVIDGIVSSLETRKMYGSRTALQYLGLQDDLARLKRSVSGCVLLTRNPTGEPARETLIARMMSLGFEEADATLFVETPKGELFRRNPHLAPVAPAP